MKKLFLLFLLAGFYFSISAQEIMVITQTDTLKAVFLDRIDYGGGVLYYFKDNKINWIALKNVKSIINQDGKEIYSNIFAENMVTDNDLKLATIKNLAADTKLKNTQELFLSITYVIESLLAILIIISLTR